MPFYTDPFQMPPTLITSCWRGWWLIGRVSLLWVVNRSRSCWRVRVWSWRFLVAPAPGSTGAATCAAPTWRPRVVIGRGRRVVIVEVIIVPSNERMRAKFYSTYFYGTRRIQVLESRSSDFFNTHWREEIKLQFWAKPEPKQAFLCEIHPSPCK